MIFNYFISIGYEKLFKKDNIQFFYNNKKIDNPSRFNFYDNDFCMTVGQLFRSYSNPIVFVNDIYNLLLIDWNQTTKVTFNIKNTKKKLLLIMNLI